MIYFSLVGMLYNSNIFQTSCTPRYYLRVLLLLHRFFLRYSIRHHLSPSESRIKIQTRQTIFLKLIVVKQGKLVDKSLDGKWTSTSTEIWNLKDTSVLFLSPLTVLKGGEGAVLRPSNRCLMKSVLIGINQWALTHLL